MEYYRKHYYVSKLFRAYRLYNEVERVTTPAGRGEFQSSFELTGYITFLPPVAPLGDDGSFKALSSLQVI